MPENRKKRQTMMHGGCLRGLVCLMLALLLVTAAVSADSTGAYGRAVNASGSLNGEAAVDPIGHSEGFSAVLYDNLSGLPTSESNAIAQTSEGFIWIGSYSGLIRYDGNSFERVDPSTGIAGVKCLFVDHLDRLWIGTTDSGLVVMEKGQFRHWDQKDGLKADNIRVVAEDESGLIYVASAGGVDMVDQNMQILSLKDSRLAETYIYDLRTGADGLLYGLTEAGDVFTLKEGEVVSYLSHEICSISNPGCLLPDPDHPGYLYLEAGISQICHGKPEDNFKEAEFFDISPLAYVQQMESIGGDLWICTRNGIGVLKEDGFHKLDGVPMNNSVGHVMTDYEGNLWFTSSRQGVMKIVPNRFLDVFERCGLEEEVVNSTCMYGEQLFIATDTGLKVADPSGVVSSLPLTKAVTASGADLGAGDLLEFLDGCRIRSIIRDSRGRLWLSTWRTRGLLRYDRGELTAFTVEDGLLSDTPRAVCEREDGAILVALTGGVNVIEGDRVTGSYSTEEGIANSESLTVACGYGGDIILGTDGGGLFIIGVNGVSHMGKEEGLSSDIIMRVKPDESRELLWLVTSNSISYMTSDYRVTTVSSFPYANNFDLYQNSADEMWVLSSDGIYVAATEDMLADRAFDPIHYGMANGLPCITTANSYSELTDDGDLYIPGKSGVTRANIDEPLVNVSDLKAVIPYIEADGIRVYPDAEGNFRVGNKVRKLTVFSYVFNYSLVDPQVSYQLEGFDREATTLLRSELAPADYTNLPGGTYRFVLELKDSLGQGSKTLSVQILKEKAFYEESWFYILAGLFALACLVVGFRMYLRARIRSLEKKHQEEKERERISTELHMANRIQGSMLPHEFPPFPDRKEFSIYASMDPAREVGGDFYDFFLIDDDHLCMVMADVSGKGIPAALFMMISKVILQSCAMLGQSPAEILVKTNEALCSGNQEEMFVTVWVGILEISSGRITAANAGHEYPAVMKEGRFSLLKDKHGFVIGGMPGMKYKEYEIRLEPGDKLFLYTDGVPEATDAENAMFGTERMLEALNEDPGAPPRSILENVRRATDRFVKDAEQFDDLTMLCLEYDGYGKAGPEDT